MKRKRVIGTTEEAIRKEESLLSRDLPPSFRFWLLDNNGLGIEGVNIYPIRDERDIRMTWESISYNKNNSWAAWLENFEEDEIEFIHLLPFADYGTGDYYCFDYSEVKEDGECPVVIWSHETGETEPRANTFSEFSRRVAARELDDD